MRDKRVLQRIADARFKAIRHGKDTEPTGWPEKPGWIPSEPSDAAEVEQEMVVWEHKHRLALLGSAQPRK